MLCGEAGIWANKTASLGPHGQKHGCHFNSVTKSQNISQKEKNRYFKSVYHKNLLETFKSNFDNILSEFYLTLYWYYLK